MKLETRTFSELSTEELYEIMRVRVAIFVVEQECPYQELDGKDQESLHVFFEEDGRILAYLRAFRKDGATVQMGRVLTVRRGQGLGAKILEAGIEQVRARFRPEKVFIEAQCYATGFYERVGFKICGEEFLEDGIPHVAMELALGNYPD